MGWVAYKYALKPVYFAMERKMVLGIKQRAEQAASVSRGRAEGGSLDRSTGAAKSVGRQGTRSHALGARPARTPVVLGSPAS